MSLETYTGFIKDIVDTNPQQTDPVAQGDDHLRGIKLTLSSQFAGLTDGIPITASESQINKTAGTFPEVIVGDNATAANNFFLSAEADDGSMIVSSGSPSAPEDTLLTITNTGAVEAGGVITAGAPGVAGNDCATVGQLILTKEYTSAAFTDYAAGGTKTLTHGLGVRPKNIQIYMRCTTAINGFVVGEEVLIGSQVLDSSATSQNRGPQISSPDISTLRLVYGSQNPFVLWNASGGNFPPSAANFEAFVRAWA